MNTMCKRINCKHIKWSNGGSESTTYWLECKLKNSVTDEMTCAKCKEREIKWKNKNL